MKLYIDSYHYGHRIVSLAKDKECAEDLFNNELSFLLIYEGRLFLYPEQTEVCAVNEDISRLSRCHNYDVFELFDDGCLMRVCDVESEENVFFITNACNSNCIMCPSSEKSRRSAYRADIPILIQIAKHMPTNLRHITVTGGEPFLIGKELFALLHFCKEKFDTTEFQILTNGRIFALKEYCELVERYQPAQTTFGIPVHAANPELHDMITQTKGSFIQTLTGIKNLLKIKAKIQLRIVVSQMNYQNIFQLAQLIIQEFPEIYQVCFIAMEMTGSAWVNRKKTWIEYGQSFQYLEQAIDVLMSVGIDVALFNYPLCMVKKQYRTLCAKSISPDKVKFDNKCSICALKDACSGIFAGTIKLEKEYLKPIQ